MSQIPSTTDVLVIGSGIAGCTAALAAARNGATVTLATKASRPEGAATDWAQGGIATTREEPTQFKQDIIAASDGTADPEAVDVLVNEAADAIDDVLIETLDIDLDRTDDGDLDYHREAAHSTNRILHVGAMTGRHILRPFLSYLDTTSDVRMLSDTAARGLIETDDGIAGAILDADPEGTPVYADATILATGGIGALYPRSTNPAKATGDGIAMAALAGAAITDMEFVQFHPTAYDPAATADTSSEIFLISEAVRGDGAVLRNGAGERFMPGYHADAELAPRDIVARAVAREREQTGEVRLDVSPLSFNEEFPALVERCQEHGVDPADGIPVAPCEHFLCGGITVDNHGRSSLSRLYAVGECARTGVHGANRLASTSLLEGLVWGRRAGRDAATVSVTDPVSQSTASTPMGVDSSQQDPPLPEAFIEEKFDRLQSLVEQALGIRRTSAEITRAETALRRLKGELDAYARTRWSRSLAELRNATITAVLIAQAAADQQESVGCHYLTDSSDSQSLSTPPKTTNGRH